MKLKIAINGKSYDVEVEDGEPASLEYSAALPLVQSTVLPSAGIGASSDLDETKIVRSPLAGVITRLQIRSGQDVKVNQLLLLMEAMKMEIKISAHSSGTIKSVEVAAGDAVRLNQVLVCLE